MSKKKKTIGRRERVDFPQLGLKNIDAKIDTGAFSSSIHCVDMQEIDNQLICKFLDDSHPAYNHKQLIFSDYEMVSVKSSNGITEVRYKIVTRMKMGVKYFDIGLTLSDRAEMKYPVLIGRRFLMGKFVVDVSKTNKLKKQKKEE